MKKSSFLIFILAFIVSVLTNCSTKPATVTEAEPEPEKISVNVADIKWVYGDQIFSINERRYDLYRIYSMPEYEKVGARLKVGGPFTLTFIPKIFSQSNSSFPIISIEGLMSVKEYNAYILAEEEIKRKALEEANKYDPLKFTIVPKDFKPADYTSIDLFTAVSNVEKMLGGNGSAYDEGVAIARQRYYVSDVVFVNQNGTDIQFRTSDNAISQIMKVDSRSGLVSGQRVRLYYRVKKNLFAEWRVDAIERL